jgi:hypothetical protein
MHYLVSVIDDASDSATPDEMAAIDAYNERLESEGHWVFAGGLASPETATVIDNRGAEAMFTDGPFVETKEYLGGLTIVDVPDEETARMWAGRIAEGCGWPQEVRRFKPGSASR